MFRNARRSFVTCVLLVALAALMVPATAFADIPGNASETILWNLENDTENRFTTLLNAASATGLDEGFEDTSEDITLFAPTDAAFAALEAELGSEDYDALVNDPQALTLTLLYHVVLDANFAAELTDGELETVLGLPISVETSPSIVLNARASVIETDNAASNGVIHVIDRVLVPEIDFEDPDFENDDSGTPGAAPSLPRTGVGPDAIVPAWPLFGLVSLGAAGVAFRQRRRNTVPKR